MKRKIIKSFSMLMLSVVLTACTNREEVLNDRVAELEAEIASLEREKESLENEIVDIKIENGTAKYIVSFNIKQSHFTLDIEQHIKDELNDISIQIPVDKEYYESVNIGDVIDESFRMGSLIMKGSFGNWEVTVDDKFIQ